MSECIFCEMDPASIKVESKKWLAFRDKFPVTESHTLLIPKNHSADFFALDAEEQTDFFQILLAAKQEILNQDSTVTGFNIGMNCGESAGQTVFHCHVHLIPRRDGDTPNPKGGVRGVIPSKQSY